MITIGLDPGDTTGIAIANAALQIEGAFSPQGFDTTCGVLEQLVEMLVRIHGPADVTIVSEQFVFLRNVPINARNVVRLEGVIQYMRSKYHCAVTFQQPDERTAFRPLANVRAYHYLANYPLPDHRRHIIDAYAHILRYHKAVPTQAEVDLIQKHIFKNGG